jgi:hypothetical protein
LLNFRSVSLLQSVMLVNRAIPASSTQLAK